MALGDWFRKWREQRLYERQAQARLGQQIDTVIDAVDPRLRMLIGYRQRLDPALRHALQVADTLYAALPPPLEVAHTRWSQEPLLRASFTTPEAIQELFDNHRVLRRFLSSAKARGATTIYAGLGMSLQLSKRFGHMSATIGSAPSPPVWKHSKRRSANACCRSWPCARPRRCSAPGCARNR